MQFRSYVVPMTERPLTAEEFEILAKEAGLSVAEICRRAKVATSTFHRWKTGESGLTIGSYVKLLDALEGRSVASESIAE